MTVHPELKNNNNGNTSNTLLFAVLLLFFLQLLGMWIESIYRMSLVKLGPGQELYGIFLLLFPLLLLFVPKKWEVPFLWCVMTVLMLCRLAGPPAGPVGQIIIGGIGVSAFLIILCYALSAPYAHLSGDMGQAAALAVLLSVMFRAWGASIDISMEGTTAVLGWILALLAMRQFRATMRVPERTLPPVASSGFRNVPAMLGLFSNLALVFLVLSCPMVVCSWNGYGQWAWSGGYACGAVFLAFIGALWLRQGRAVSRRLFFIGWNALFLFVLVGGLFWGKPLLPMSVELPVVHHHGATVYASIAHTLALLFSGVVIFNVRRSASLFRSSQPRDAVLPVLMGMGLLFALSFLLILTNVWGYVPLGHFFRNRFYLPFLLAGIVMFAPWVCTMQNEWVGGSVPGRTLRRSVGILFLLAALGTVAYLPWKETAESRPELTVLTYNMQQGSHARGHRNYRKQRDLLRALNPDLIGLQECDTARPSGGHVDAVRYLAASLGYYAYYGPGSIAGTFGCAILSRYPIRNPRVLFSYSDVDEVGSAAAEIDKDGRQITFVSNHPAGGDPVMNAHVDALIADVRHQEYVVAVGDYNFTSQTPYYVRLAGVLKNSAMELAPDTPSPTPDAMQPDHAIDHIFVSSNIRVVESRYLPPPDSQTDHPAHWAVLEME